MADDARDTEQAGGVTATAAAAPSVPKGVVLDKDGKP
jgi:hypothetical protein